MKRISPHSMRRIHRRGSGQVLLVVVVMLVVILVFGFFLFDLQGIIRLRARSQTGVDAAALAGAAWQGRTLNMIGELNLLKATTVMLTDSEDPTSPVDVAHTEQMTQLQARLAYVGPMMGLAAAQQAAKQNGLRSDSGYTSAMWEHYNSCLSGGSESYYADFYGTDPDNFGFSWVSLYSTLLFDVMADGIAANPTNTRLLNGSPVLLGAGGSLLADADFYKAVYARDYCWFYRRGIGPSHGPIDLSGIRYERNTQAFFPGSEYLSLRINFSDSMDPAQISGVSDLHVTRGQQALSAGQEDVDKVRWAVYDADWNETGNYEFINKYLRSSFKTEYTYGGACARFITHAYPQYISHNKSWKYGEQASVVGEVQSTASAKPFGSINSTAPQSIGLVLPVFTETRLIPTSLVTATPYSEDPDFYKFIIDYFGNPDYPNVPSEISAKYAYYLNAIKLYNDSASAFSTSWWTYDSWRTTYMAGADGQLGTADDRKDPCTPVFRPGGGGGSSGGPDSLH